MRTSLILFIVCIPFLPAFAGFEYTKAVEQCHQDILNLNFAEAKKKTQHANYIDNSMWHWLLAEYNFVHYLTQTPFQNPDEVLKIIDEAIDEIKRNETECAAYYGTLSDLFWYKCFIHFQQANYLATWTNYQHAKRQIKRLESEYSSSWEHKKHFIIEDLIHAQANKSLGLSYSISNKSAALIKSLDFSMPNRNKRELEIIVPYLLYSLNNSPGQLPWLNRNYYDTGPLENFSFVFTMAKNKNYDKQKQALQTAYENNWMEQLPYLQFLYGATLVNRSESAGAEMLQNFINAYPLYPGNSSARLKLSWYYLANAQLDAYKNTLEQITKLTDSDFYLDKQAIYEFRNLKNWTPELTKARLLFDAGDYGQSLKILLMNKNKVAAYNNSQRLEYSYRLARAYDMLGEAENAEKFYRMVIYSRQDNVYYYPAYAAYYAGLLHVNKNMDKALSYFLYCLKLDSPVYKHAIHQKAKKASENLKNI